MTVQTKLLLIDFRDDRSPADHPQVAPFLKDGWLLHSVAYRIVEPRVPKLLVKLIAPHKAPREAPVVRAA